MRIVFNQNQTRAMSKYLADISKIICGSVVINFFVTSADSQITPALFIIGCVLTSITLGFSLHLSK